MRNDTLVTTPLDAEEAKQAKEVYFDSTEQPVTYKSGPPHYATLVADLVASMQPESVLEFGCNGGRNLALVRDRWSKARLSGVDVNALNIEAGRKQFGLQLEVADENWLRDQPADSFDVSFTVSVIDHIPYPEMVLRDLLRVTKHYLVLFELAHDRIGKASRNLAITDTEATLTSSYRYSYIHDYRHECERKFGAKCYLDVHYPIGEKDLHALYRLYVFSKRPELTTRRVLQSVTWKPIGSD